MATQQGLAMVVTLCIAGAIGVVLLARGAGKVAGLGVCGTPLRRGPGWCRQHSIHLSPTPAASAAASSRRSCSTLLFAAVTSCSASASSAAALPAGGSPAAGSAELLRRELG